MKKTYQGTQDKSKQKFEVIGKREMWVEVPMRMVEVWKELQAHVEKLTGCDAFTLARIAGHSSITITQKYVHPQADAIERAFSKLGSGQPQPVPIPGGSNIGHTQETRLPRTGKQSITSDSFQKG